MKTRIYATPAVKGLMLIFISWRTIWKSENGYRRDQHFVLTFLLLYHFSENVTSGPKMCTVKWVGNQRAVTRVSLCVCNDQEGGQSPLPLLYHESCCRRWQTSFYVFFSRMHNFSTFADLSVSVEAAPQRAVTNKTLHIRHHRFAFRAPWHSRFLELALYYSFSHRGFLKALTFYTSDVYSYVIHQV